MDAVAFALTSSLGFGASDFLASRAGRRLTPALLVLSSTAIQAVVILLTVFATQQPFGTATFAWGCAAGTLSGAGLILYYQALAAGKTAVVAPLASSGAVVPVLVGVLRGDTPGVVTGLGILVVFAGIVLTTFAPDTDPTKETPPPRRDHRRQGLPLPRPSPPVVLALCAALTFGMFFLFTNQASASAGAGVLWAALGVQIGALPPALVVAIRMRRGGTPTMGAGANPRVLLILLVVAVAILNFMGEWALLYGFVAGSLGVVSVLASLAPVLTVLLALIFTSERPTRLQALGAACAMVGTLVVSAAQ